MKNLLDKILHSPLSDFIYDLYNDRKPLKLIYDPLDLDIEYYNRIKNLGDAELEHQVGRLTNFKEIIDKCKKLKGDFVEYGSWQGFSLLWIGYLMERQAMFDRKIIGLDGFIGLPFSDGVFKKGQFINTSYKLCKRNVYKNNILYDRTKKNMYIGRFLFNQKQEIYQYFKNIGVSQFCFIHIDCDISQPIKDIFDVLTKKNLIANKAYILFDDYGWKTKMKETVDKTFKTLSADWSISEDSGTKYTKNFYFVKK